MSNKQFNARMQQKIDTYENWSKATNFIPLKGELIIYTTDENGNEKIGFKVGTGDETKNVHQLDFISFSEAAAIAEVDWEDIKNKPFGEEGWSITWDGTPTDESTGACDLMLYKVSDLSPTKEEIVGATCGVDGVGITPEKIEILENMIMDFNEYCYCVVAGETPVVFVASQTTEIEIEGYTFSFSSGVWFINQPDYMYTSYLGNGGSIKTLDEKFIPDTIARKSDIPEIPEIDLSGKADLVDGKVPLEQLPDDIGSGGGLTEVSWEDIKDKPFYEMGFNYEWDGNTEGLESFDVAGAFNFYKVSSDIPSKEKLTEAIFSSYFDGDLLEGTIGAGQIADFIDTNNGNFIILFGGELPIAFIVSVAGEDSAMGTSFEAPSTGLWFMSANEGEYTRYVKSAENLVKTLDKKFIPSEIGTWAGTPDKPFGEVGTKIEWDGTPTDVYETFDTGDGIGYFYKVSEPVDTIIDGTAYIISMDGESEQPLSSDVVQVIDGGENGIYIMNVKAPNSVFAHPAGVDITFKEVGLYFFYANIDGQEAKITLFTSSDYGIKPIDKKYLPDNIGGGVTSWNDLEDKPFYEEGLQIVWDGISSEYEPIDARDTLGCMCYKVGEKLEKDDIIGCTITMSEDINPIVVDSSMIIDFNDKTFAVMYNGNTPVLFVSSERNTVDLSIFGLVGQTLEVPFDGLWFYLFNDGRFTQSILSPDYEIKQIDKKYIPDIYLKSAAAGTPNGVATLDSTGKVPVEQLPDNIGGGSSSPIEVSWEDIENKPFYETGWSIEWDGTPTDEFFDVTDTMGAILYKVGESKTKEELIGATCKYNTFEPVETIEYTIASSDIMDTDSENCFVIFHNGIDGIAVSVLIDGSYNFMGINFTLTKGIWFVKSSNYTPIYLGGKEIKQIAPKFIPNYFGEIGFYTDCDISKATAAVSVPVNEDEFGISEFNFFKFSEPVEGSIKGYLLSILVDEENMEIPMGDEDRDASLIVSDTGSEYTLYALNIKTNNEIVNMEDFGLPIFTVAEAGLYVLDVSLLGGQVNYFKSPDYNMIKIDKKFIPDDITAAVSITYDEFPIEGSQNPVKSAGIHSAISALESKVTSAFCYKGTVKNYADLPIEGNSIGDVWNIVNADEINEVEAGDNAAWDGESWDILAGVIDLSNYYTKEEINTLIGNCDTVINSINTLIGGV